MDLFTPNEDELIKPIPGHPLYSITSYGRVVSHKTYGDYVKRYSDVKGYAQVQLTNDKRVTVHRLVAEAFLPPRNDPKHQIDHIDNDPMNNHVSNLRWVTSSENLRRIRHRRPSKFLPWGDVCDQYLSGLTAPQLAIMYGVNERSIYAGLSRFNVKKRAG